VVSEKLTYGANYPDKTENESVNPTRATSEAMATTYDDCDYDGWNVDDELGHRNPSSSVDMHCWVRGRNEVERRQLKIG